MFFWAGSRCGEFPFLFGGTFIEGQLAVSGIGDGEDFPSFSEGLSLRVDERAFDGGTHAHISLPFRRDFH